MDAACGVMFCNCLEADFVFYVLSDLYLKFFSGLWANVGKTTCNTFIL